MKRLCIYLIYDTENVVDDYIGYILRELRKIADKLLVVCNFPSIEQGIQNVLPYADRIYYRENKGYDAGAYKDALCNLIGWKEIENYEELLLINDSFFGPFAPLKEIITRMENRQDDFWGLTMHGGTGEGGIPEHIQTFFTAVQSRMLHSQAFRQYWEELPYFKNFDEVVRMHEMKFTKYFVEAGFSCSAMADTGHNDSLDKRNNYLQYALISCELIKKRNFPFLKKQQFGYNTLNMQTQENLRQAIDYVDQHTDYDVRMIWHNLIRTMYIPDLQRSLHLHYILSSEEKPCKEHSDIMIAVSADFLNACEYTIEYLERLQHACKISVYAENDEICAFYQSNGIACVKTSLDVCKELGALKNYRYVCFIHDEDMSSEELPSCIHKSHFFHIWDNLLRDIYFVERVLERFESEPELGVLMPPQPNFARYFGESGKGWDGGYEKCRDIVQRKRLKCRLAFTKPPLGIGNNCWMRGKLLKRLAGWEDVSFTNMQYLWAFIAQDQGYYSGALESAEHASLNAVNQQYYLNEICDLVRQKFGDFDSFIEMKKLLFKGRLEAFCRKYAKLYIYGTGYMAKQYRNMIPAVQGYIVSDGQPITESMDGLPVLHLSKLEFDEETGVVVCVEQKLQEQITPMLDARGLRDYICI